MTNEKTFYYRSMFEDFRNKLKNDPEVKEIICRNESDRTCEKYTISWR